MAENNMPDKTEQPVLDNTAAQNAPTPPGLTTEKAATLAHEGKAASAPEKPAPGREPIPIFKENPISTVSGPEKPAPARKGRPKSEKAPEAPAAGDNRPPWEKPLSEPQPPAKKRGRKPNADKPEKPTASTAKKVAAPKKEAPAPTEEVASVPREAPRPAEAEQVVFIPLSELHPFKDHPFGVRDDKEMRALAESVKEKGVNQPALVRPRPEGGYELIAGHRRHKASELADFTDMRCIVRNMTDEEAILAMTDDNLRQRSEILPSEKAVSLKMQVEAIKRQGARTSGQIDQNDAGKRSVDIVGERNSMNAKQVQRYMRLTELVPDLITAVNEKKLSFTPAVEISFIKPKNQRLIAISLEGQQSSPSLSQAQKMRELDKDGKLNGDVIDGILSQEKKEVDKVIISSEELGKYFGKDKTPREMKDQIIKLLDDWSGKEKGHEKPEKKPALEK